MTAPTLAKVASPGERLRTELTTAIAEIINVNGWSQTYAANALGCSQPSISAIHRGETVRVSMDSLLDVAATLSIKVRVTGPDGSSEDFDNGRDLRMALLDRMAAYMFENGMSLRASAEMLGTNIQRISDIRSRRDHRISIKTAVDLAAHHFDISAAVQEGQS